MARLRFNDISSLGIINPVTLALNGTTATWLTAPAFPTITAPDYAVIVVEPDTAHEEIVQVTAYTAGATSATVVRNFEATSGGANAAPAHISAIWGHGPTAADFSVANLVDYPATTDARYALITETTDVVTLTAGGTQAIPDVTADTIHAYTFGAGNVTFTFPAAARGKSFTLALTQDGTGSRTATWPSTATVRWSGGTTPVLTTTAAKTDYLSFVCTDGTHWDGFTSGLNF